MNEIWEYGADAGPEHVDDAPDGIPWPPAEGESALGAFGATWKSATLDPGTFYGRVPRDGGTGAALLYYLLIVVLVAGATLFWDSLALFSWSFEEAAGGPEALDPLIGFFLTPAILLVMLLVAAGITHLLLALFDGASGGFGTTVRVFSYAYSPGLFGVVPLVGGLIGSIWMLVLLIIGLREAHDTEGWKTAVAVLLPFALLMGFLVLSFMVLFAAGAAILGGAGGV